MTYRRLSRTQILLFESLLRQMVCVLRNTLFKMLYAFLFTAFVFFLLPIIIMNICLECLIFLKKSVTKKTEIFRCFYLDILFNFAMRNLKTQLHIGMFKFS